MTFNPTSLLVICAALAACSSAPKSPAPPAAAGGGWIKLEVPYSKECKAATGFTQYACKACNPDVCLLLIEGCVRPEFCSAAAQTMSEEIDPCVHLTLEDLYPVAECQRLGEQMQLRRTAIPPSSWSPTPNE